MEAYLVPVLAAFAGAFLTASVLGAVRLGHWWLALRGRAHAPAGDPGPGIPDDASDPHFSRLAHRTLGAALLIGMVAFFFFARPGVPGHAAVGLPAAGALLAAWAVARNPQ
jgi:hypothetical protein